MNELLGLDLKSFILKPIVVIRVQILHKIYKSNSKPGMANKDK